MAFNAPVTANVQALPGLRLIRATPELPFKVAFPSTVMVRPPKLTKLEEVPLVTVKSPLLTVLMFKLVKSRIPADWEKEAQIRG